MRASVPRLLLHLAAHVGLYGRSRSTRPAAFLLRFQSLDGVLLEALIPAGDCRRGSAQCLVDLHVAEAIGQGEDQSCSKDISGRQFLSCRSLLAERCRPLGKDGINRSPSSQTDGSNPGYSKKDGKTKA
jgi:hypothetical protein